MYNHILTIVVPKNSPITWSLGTVHGVKNAVESSGRYTTWLGITSHTIVYTTEYPIL